MKTEQKKEHKKEQYLNLNVSKTKDMCIDFWRNHIATSSTVINNQPIELVEVFMFYN